MDFEKCVVKLHGDMIVYNAFVPFEKNEVNSITGSAFFINERDLLTCHHCVDSCIDVSISLPALDKSRYPVKVVAVIPELDMAVLRLHEKDNVNHTWIPISDEPVKHLDTVVALGYPLDSDSLKYTQGIVSGTFDEFIQMDATINPGNSGGPLVRNNKVIGINSQKDEMAENTGFAVPSRCYTIWKKYINEMYRDVPIVIRLYDPRIQISNLNPYVVQHLKISSGVIVTKSRQEKGIKKGDIITHFQGRPIDNFGYIINRFGNKVHLLKATMLLSADDDLEFTVFRDKQVQRIRPPYTTSLNSPTRQIYLPFEPLPCVVVGGIVFMDLRLNHVRFSFKHGKIHGEEKVVLTSKTITDPYDPAVFISSIVVGSPVTGLEAIFPGDIVTKINGNQVKTLDELRAAFALVDNGLVTISCLSKRCLIYPLASLREIDTQLLKIYEYKKHLLA